MIKFKEGQEVYHARFGKGVVQSISTDEPPIISVDFDGTIRELLYDNNLLLRMVIREPKVTQSKNSINVPNSQSPKDGFFSSLVLPPDIEIKQFEGMDRFHFKFKDKGFLVIDLKENAYHLRTREEYLKAIGINEYMLDSAHPTNPARIANIPYNDTRVLRKLINYVISTTETGINLAKEPIKAIRINGNWHFVCPTCKTSFKKAKRCPNCGQLILFEESGNVKNSRTIHIGDDVSKLKIYEIINKYFGQNYSGWMKAGYEINKDYWAWFPTITKTNERPNGSYGGTAMWSNVLSSDRRTLITTNHDEYNKMPNAEQHRNLALIFARIDGIIQFLGVFEGRHVPQAVKLTYKYDRVAQGIELDTFKLIDKD